ncbi:unnamed protein product [Ostreobium quekettii]|uniref:Uncharacterized protein n=1 Tax=Ostreobium quekettii TaxID=121088 RepID=A0A8S1JAD3_9CHLO|nr:unnamed protein product [Ostreobium quekettii]
MALRALGAFASRRGACQVRALAVPMLAGPSDQLWAPAAQDAASLAHPAGAAAREPVGLAPWSLIAVRGKRTGAKGMLDALSDEIEHEEENYKADETLESGPPNGFQLEDIPGKTRLLLKKKHRDTEEIEIDLQVSEQPPPTEAYDGHPEDLDSDKAQSRSLDGDGDEEDAGEVCTSHPCTLIHKSHSH